jgi:hypothetical protein
MTLRMSKTETEMGPKRNLWAFYQNYYFFGKLLRLWRVHGNIISVVFKNKIFLVFVYGFMETDVELEFCVRIAGDEVHWPGFVGRAEMEIAKLEFLEVDQLWDIFF